MAWKDEEIGRVGRGERLVATAIDSAIESDSGEDLIHGGHHSLCLSPKGAWPFREQPEDPSD